MIFSFNNQALIVLLITISGQIWNTTSYYPVALLIIRIAINAVKMYVYLVHWESIRLTATSLYLFIMIVNQWLFNSFTFVVAGQFIARPWIIPFVRDLDTRHGGVMVGSGGGDAP